ncbi:MAG: NAD(P)-dependent oxidoreductase, partial [Candidatus Macondimonas sp.]
MGFYPVFLKLDAMPCTVVGGGAVAARKVAGLLAAGAVVDIIAPQLHPTLAALRDGGQIRWRAGRFPEEDPGRP